MPPDHTAAPNIRPLRFATTRWSCIHNASDASSPTAMEALETLCQAYWSPLYVFARRLGYDVHQAEDLTQAFFAHFIERGYLRAADRTRGRFRTFLLTCFRHFLHHEWEKTHSLKRGGHIQSLSWEEQRSEVEARLESPSEISPERQFDREWALTVLKRAWVRLKQEMQESGRQRQWDVLGRFLHNEAESGEYEQAATLLGVDGRAVKLAIHRLRRRFGRLIRDEVRETLAGEADVADEVDYLVELMAG